MFTKRSLIAMASLAAVSAAFAGPINIVGSYESSFSYASTSEAGSAQFSQQAYDIAPGLYYSFALTGGGNSSAYNFSGNYLSVADFGTSSYLTGNSQSFGSTTAGNGAAAAQSGAAYHEVYFTLTATSDVTLSLSADADGETRTRGRSGGENNSSGFAGFFAYTQNGWEDVATLTDSDSLVINGQLGPGLYAFSAYGSSSASAYGNAASSSSYGYGAYSLYATEPVPEPMSLAALAVGAAALLRRRRRVIR